MKFPRPPDKCSGIVEAHVGTGGCKMAVARLIQQSLRQTQKYRAGLEQGMLMHLCKQKCSPGQQV